MTHTLAMEWAKYGIRVNSVSPGLVRTAMTYWVDQQPDWEQQLKYYGGIPRLAEVQELGGAYVYLLSDAASYTTSIDIPVNGVIGSRSKPGLREIQISNSPCELSLLEDRFCWKFHRPNRKRPNESSPIPHLSGYCSCVTMFKCFINFQLTRIIIPTSAFCLIP